MRAAIGACRDVVQARATRSRARGRQSVVLGCSLAYFKVSIAGAVLLTGNRVEECVREAGHEPGRAWVSLQRSTEGMGDDVA